MREALQLSLNIPVVALTDALGPAKLLAAMRRAGIEPVIPGDQPGLAMALGGIGVTLEDMVQLYAALARGGVALPLHVTGETTAEGQRVVSRRRRLAGGRHPRRASPRRPARRRTASPTRPAPAMATATPGPSALTARM